jgi:hypothetical protein
MPSWSHRARRVIVGFGLTGLLAAGCATSDDRPTLVDSRGATDTATAMETLAVAEDADALPELRMPELLGLEDARPGLGTAPGSLAFELGPTTADDSPGRQATAIGQAEPVQPADGTDSEGGAESGQVEESRADTDTSDDEAAEDEDVPLPPAPVAAPGPEPRYEDPSELVVGVSGRAFDLLESGDTRRGIDDETIVVGGLATESLAGFAHRDSVCDGAEARFNQANQNNELSRSITFVGCQNDAGQAGFSDGLARNLIREDVFAVVPMASDAFFSEAVLNDERAMYVGSNRLPGFCGRSNPLGFGTRGARGCPVLDARGYVALVEPVLAAYAAAEVTDDPWSGLTYAVTTGADGEAVASARLFEAELLRVPAPTVVATLPTAGEGARTNWAATIEALLRTEPNVLILDGPLLDGLPDGLRNAGYDGLVVIVGAPDPLDVADPDFRSALGAVVTITKSLNPTGAPSRGWNSILGAGAAIGIDEGEIGLDFLDGYISADFLVQALAATAEPLTVEAVAAAVNGGWWYPGIDGVSCGSWWPASHFIETPCVSVARVDVFSDRLVPVLGLVETAPQVRFNLAG